MGSRGVTLRRVGAGNSAMRNAQEAQYTSFFPLILNHKPPQRSQYFNSNSMIPFSSVFMIFLQGYEFVWSLQPHVDLFMNLAGNPETLPFINVFAIHPEK